MKQLFGQLDAIVDAVDVVGLAFVALDDVFVGFVVGEAVDIFILVGAPEAVEVVVGEAMTFFVFIVDGTAVDVFLDEVVDAAPALDAVLPESAFAGIVGDDEVDVGVDFVHDFIVDCREFIFDISKCVVGVGRDVVAELLGFGVGEVDGEGAGVAMVHAATAVAKAGFALYFVDHKGVELKRVRD